MRKMLASSLVLASVLVGTLVAPSIADDDTFKNVAMIPIKVCGSAVGTAIGVPEGSVKYGTRGAIKASKWVAGKLGNEDGVYQLWAGGIFGGPLGALGGAAYGWAPGAWHGAKTGYQKPFTKDSFTFKDE